MMCRFRCTSMRQNCNSRTKGLPMTTKIFVNLPVRNLENSIRFFKALGFSFNPQFTDLTATCMIVASDIFVMLLVEARFAEFTPKPVADASKTTEVLTCLGLDSKASVDVMVDAALKSGATKTKEPTDYGFMYGRSFNDLDGHIWEIMWMNPDHVHPTNGPGT